MEFNSQYQKYRMLSINTLTPGERIILLYDELFLQINRAILHIEKKKVGDAHHNIIKAENIILYLVDVLDLSYPISQDLLKLYEYIYQQLVNANTIKDKTILQALLPFIIDLKNTWQQAEKDLRQKQMVKDQCYE